MSSVARQDAGQNGGLISNLLSGGFYKPSQGRVVRQVTFVFLALFGVLIAWALADPAADLIKWLVGLMTGAEGAPASGWLASVQYPVLIVLASLGVWISFRLVNYPKFADFLISVEAEMNKVTWPSRGELWRASGVVIFVIFALAGTLLVFDLVWTALLQFLRVRY